MGSIKNKIRFWGLYLSIIIIFIIRYFTTMVIKLYEDKLWELFNPKAAWLGYLRNAVDVMYYLGVFILLILLCSTKKFKCSLEVLFLALPACILLLASVIMINPFVWIFLNSAYCIPFGAMLLIAFLYRFYVYKIQKSRESSIA